MSSHCHLTHSIVKWLFRPEHMHSEKQEDNIHVHDDGNKLTCNAYSIYRNWQVSRESEREREIVFALCTLYWVLLGLFTLRFNLNCAVFVHCLPLPIGRPLEIDRSNTHDKYMR